MYTNIPGADKLQVEKVGEGKKEMMLYKVWLKNILGSFNTKHILRQLLLILRSEREKEEDTLL